MSVAITATATIAVIVIVAGTALVDPRRRRDALGVKKNKHLPVVTVVDDVG